MLCNHCGANNEDGARFCAECGREIAASSNNFYAAPAQNSYSQPSQPVEQSQPGKGLAIAAMICGIVSFFCFGFILGLLGIIFGAVAKSKGCRSGMATAGIVCGAIGLGLWLIMIIFFSGPMMAVGMYGI